MASFGDMLRRERELRRVSLREISEATKINIRYLEALERNDFEYLPGGAFNKGFIRAYARTIGVDDVEMINAYLYEVAAQTDGDDDERPDAGRDPLLQHFGIADPREAARRRLARIAVLAAGALLLVAIVLGGVFAAYKLLDPAAGRDVPTVEDAR